MRMAPDAWLQDVGKVTQVFQKAAEANLRTPGRSGCVVDLPAKGRATLTGDLHDNYVNFMHVMKLARINYSDQYHVVFQEVIHGDTLYNGNDLSYRTLAKVAKLKMEKPGQVHQLLSNHELSQLTGDGILKDGVSVVEAFHGGLQYVFGDAWLGVDEALREYIRTLPLAVRCANGMFVAHSLPSPRQRRDFDPEILKRRITDADRMGLEGSAHIMVWGRGLTQWVADELAGKWGARIFVLGHQFAEMGWEKIEQTILILNSDHEHGVALPIDLSRDYNRQQLIDSIVPLNAVGAVG